MNGKPFTLIAPPPPSHAPAFVVLFFLFKNIETETLPRRLHRQHASGPLDPCFAILGNAPSLNARCSNLQWPTAACNAL